MIQHFYTTYGDVYSGWEFKEHKFPEYTMVIQGTKLKDYQELNDNDKTIDKISEYGWALPDNTIVRVSGKRQNVQYPQGDNLYGNIERKYLFIIGAGASANCIYGSYLNDFNKDPMRPPLGTGLFEKRFKVYYSKYKGVRQSLQNLQNDTTLPNVEEILEEEWQEIQKSNNQQILSRHINLQYYIQDLLKDISNHIIENYYEKNLYGTLASKLQRIHRASIKTWYNQTFFKKFAFISFNQDSILEHFIGEYFNRPINTLNDYAEINNSPYCIFKPHGSWNWGWKFPDSSKFGGQTAKWLFDNEVNFFKLYFELLGNPEDMIDWSAWGLNTEHNKHDLGKYTIDKSQLKLIGNNNLNDYFPALLLPYRDKDEFTMPLRHYINMHTYIGYAETLVIIGWKGNEAAFNNLLNKHGNRINKVIIVDPNVNIVKQNLQFLISRVLPENIIHYKTFEDFVLNGVDYEIT